MSWCIEDYLLLPGQKWNSMKLLLFRLPGVSNLSTGCLITLDSLDVWLSRQQSLVWLKLTCYFENAESELSAALASFTKNNYFGCTGNSLSCDFDLLHSDRDQPEFNKHESAPITDSGWKGRSNSLASLVRRHQLASGMFLVRDAIFFLHCMPPTLQQLGGGRFNDGD